MLELEQAVALAKSGDKAGAINLLRRIVANDPHNARAWGWLATCASTVDERRQALERVLEIDPENVGAQCALVMLRPSTTEGAQPPGVSVEPPDPASPTNNHPHRFRSWFTTKRHRAAVAFSLLLFVACCCPLAAIGTLLKEEQPSAAGGRAAVVEDLERPSPTPTPVATVTQSATPERRDTPQVTATPEPTRRPNVTETPAPSPTPVIAIIEAQVVKVLDGDTIIVSINGVEHTVRYIGITAPETKPPSEPQEWMGLESAAANEELVGGKTVRLKKDVSETDPQGRLLRYVYVGDTLVNHELVRLGFAEASVISPDTHYDELLAAAQREARAAGLGVWAAPAPVGLDCLESTYVADVTVPDETRFVPAESFTKTWRVRNTGTCPWPPATQLDVVSDDALLSPASVHVGALRAGETTEVSVEMTAPAAAGSYRETWRLSQDGERFFGGNLTVVVNVQVAPPTQAPSPP